MIDGKRLQLPEMKPGSVWLVGAGPGDPGLLSVLALHALGQADAIVCDALVDPRILAEASASYGAPERRSDIATINANPFKFPVHTWKDPGNNENCA